MLYKTRVAIRFRAKKPSPQTTRNFGVGIPVVRTKGRAGGPSCTVTWLPNFLGWLVYHIFLPMVLCFARFARESFVMRFAVARNLVTKVRIDQSGTRLLCLLEVNPRSDWEWKRGYLAWNCTCA